MFWIFTVLGRDTIHSQVLLKKYEFFTCKFQENRSKQLEEKLRVLQISKDELQSYSNQQQSTISELTTKVGSLSLEAETYRRRIDELNEVRFRRHPTIHHAFCKIQTTLYPKHSDQGLHHFSFLFLMTRFD